MDPATAVVTGLAVLGSKDVLVKLLGPTADYVGGEIKNFVQKCNINLDNIFRNATQKLGPELLNQPGGVNARVLKHVVDEGRFCEDELTAEYYGGILASARTVEGRDDRGVTLLAVVKDLSVYQLRFHFLAYSLVNQHFRGQQHNLGDANECHKLKMYIPIDVYEEAMAFSPSEDKHAILGHTLYGLSKHGLIRDFSSGTAEFLQKKCKYIEEFGVTFSPTLPGAELFLWAVGLQGASGKELLSAEVVGAPEEFKLIEGATSIEKMKAEGKAKEGEQPPERDK